MADQLSARQLIEIAKVIESCGEAFYTAALAESRPGPIREVFTTLLEEEQQHHRDLDATLARAGDDTPPADEDYFEHIRALAEYQVFPDPAAARALVVAVDAPATLIRYAINFEKDTILFLHEIRERVGAEAAPLVDRLIEEERGHLRRLNQLGRRG